MKAQEERDALEALKRQHTGNTQAVLFAIDVKSASALFVRYLGIDAVGYGIFRKYSKEGAV